MNEAQVGLRGWLHVRVINPLILPERFIFHYCKVQGLCEDGEDYQAIAEIYIRRY